MEYEKIILELLVRVKTLEEQVAALQEGIQGKTEKQLGTKDIKAYICSLKNEAKEYGQKSLVLKANDIHKQLRLKSRMPAVCNAMKYCMEDGDEILHETASGFSSTFEVKYYLEH